MTQWLVARTRPQAEAQAEFHLRRQGFEVYLPKYLKLRRHARRRDWVPRPLFPRYLFVGIDPDRSRWRTIGSTIGISHLVCFGDRPVRLPQRILAELRAREDESGMITLANRLLFKKGDPVQIVSGALCDQIGLFDSVSDDQRVTVLLNFLGRMVKVRVPAEVVDGRS